MSCQVEYHRVVKRGIAATVAVFGLIFFAAVFSSTSAAQIKGAPASVTSPGFGGRAINGTPPNVTSLGRQGYAPVVVPGGGHNSGHQGNLRRRSHDGAYYGGVYVVPAPYADNATSDVEDDANYQGGPTIFDRRGSGAQAYIPPVADATAPHAQNSVQDPPESESAPDPTLLVFKDGHQIEVGNYAIVGRTLYDMTPGHPRKVALADLDIDATQKQNEKRGVTFQLPPSAQGN